MRELNLKAEEREQKLILAYLQDNVSDVLADKINNGVYINKDVRRLYELCLRRSSQTE